MEELYQGRVVRFMHYWAADEVKPRNGVIVLVDHDEEQVVVAPGRS